MIRVFVAVLFWCRIRFVRKTRLRDAFLDDPPRRRHARSLKLSGTRKGTSRERREGSTTTSGERFSSDGHDDMMVLWKHDQDTDEGTDDHVTEEGISARRDHLVAGEALPGQSIRNQKLGTPAIPIFPDPLALRDDIQTLDSPTLQGNFKLREAREGGASSVLYPLVLRRRSRTSCSGFEA
ncbi:hypothetical protein ZWY2020_014442 [Hordeum vulgare]|nr:hypothetical protein ZWY2020_014442 [Hordeum vulgare]